jgi:GAF domain-containing protein
MTAAPFPSDEPDRLKALKAAGLLDTPATPELDRLTGLAARVFSADIALITLIDEHRQWFKSKTGLDLSETARNISFCAHCMLSDEPFVVLDASADPRFRDNPMVTGAPDIRFYAGVPIRILGYRSGSFAIIGRQPRRSFLENERQSLKDFGAITERELEQIRKEVTSGERRPARETAEASRSDVHAAK